MEERKALGRRMDCSKEGERGSTKEAKNKNDLALLIESNDLRK